MLDRPPTGRYGSLHVISPYRCLDLAFWPGSSTTITDSSGAQRENRTLDLFITSEMLYRLSYLGARTMLAGGLARIHA